MRETAQLTVHYRFGPDKEITGKVYSMKILGSSCHSHVDLCLAFFSCCSNTGWAALFRSNLIANSKTY